MKPVKKIKEWCAAACLMALLAVMQGCVNDDLEDCGIGVRFRYVKNVDRIDKFASSVDRITLFVFDGDGKFIEEYHAGGELLKKDYVMILPLRAGDYKLVAWGNPEEEDYEITPCQAGVTTLDEVMLSLRRAEKDTVTGHPAHLFHAGVQDVTISSNYEGRKYLTMDMTKNTNTIRVEAFGLPLETNTNTKTKTKTGLSGTTFDCIITSKNGDYKFDNSITGPRLTYIPHYSTEDNTLVSDFVILRELNDGLTDSRLIIKHYPGESGANGGIPYELFNASLTGLLVPAAVSGDLDIDDEYDIELWFDYTNGTATIVVNGWTITETPGVIG